MQPADTVEVETPVIACDGGDGALGHPRVFLSLTGHDRVACPYCGREYVLRHDARIAVSAH